MGSVGDIGDPRRIGDGASGVEDVAPRPSHISVEAANRWDAVDLLRRLHSLRAARTYMIQSAPDRWLVYAQPHVRTGPVYAQLDACVAGWRVDRGL
jgi:hypothetical protein